MIIFQGYGQSAVGIAITGGINKNKLAVMIASLSFCLSV
jgi:hypothetical protein